MACFERVPRTPPHGISPPPPLSTWHLTAPGLFRMEYYTAGSKAQTGDEIPLKSLPCLNAVDLLLTRVQLTHSQSNLLCLHDGSEYSDL